VYYLLALPSRVKFVPAHATTVVTGAAAVVAGVVVVVGKAAAVLPMYLTYNSGTFSLNLRRGKQGTQQEIDTAAQPNANTPKPKASALHIAPVIHGPRADKKRGRRGLGGEYFLVSGGGTNCEPVVPWVVLLAGELYRVSGYSCLQGFREKQ
jgi:hypothetical protein